jgi:tRNA(Glu) U13 pseudouridine synthase TruD
MTYHHPLQDLGLEKNEITSSDDSLSKEELASPSKESYQALDIEFDLSPSQYATMTLREILKFDTSHANLKRTSTSLRDKRKSDELA